MKKKQTLLALSGFFLLGLVGCSPNLDVDSSSTSSSPSESTATSSSSVHTHNYQAHEEVAATCASEGSEAYYSCTLCDEIFDASKNVIESVPVLPKDPSNHAKTPSFVISGEPKKSYAVGDTFDLGEAVFKIKCDDCEGVALSDAQLKILTYTYPTDSATKFTAADVGSDKKVTVKYGNYEPITFSVTVAKRVTSIDGIIDMNEHCGFIAFESLGYVTSTDGDIVYTFSETKDGDYVSAKDWNAAHPSGMTVGSNDESKTYYAKATVVEADEYVGASQTFAINITHQDAADLKWQESADGSSDIYGCPDKTPVTYRKKVTATNQDILLNDTAATDKFAISLEGVDPYSEVKSIKYGDYDLGTDISNLSIDDKLKKDYAKHGEASIEVTVSVNESGDAPKSDHVIKVPVTFITKEITSAEDFNNWITATKSDDVERLVVDGYYKQTADSISPARGTLSGWDDYFVGTYDGNGKKIAFNSNLSTGGGLFGNNLGQSSNGATIKNLTIVDGYNANGMDNVLLAKAIWDTTFTNVTFNLAGSATPTYKWNSGWLASQRMQNTIYKNCTFNCIGLDMGSIFGGHVTKKDNETSSNYKDNVFENSVLNCKSYWCLWNLKESADDLAKDSDKLVTSADGLTINTGSLSANAISGLKDNYDEHCGYNAPSTIDGVKATGGGVIFTYSETKDGTYVSADEFNKAHTTGMVVTGEGESTVYYGKASVTDAKDGNNVYYADTSKDFTITITHNDGGWNTSGEDVDTYGQCVCVAGADQITFSKKVTATNQDIDLNGSNQKISLDGIGKYETVKSIKCDDYDFGTDIDNLVIPETLKADYDKHTSATLTVVVHSAAYDDATETDHTIKVPVTFLTKAIASKDDFTNYVQLSSTRTEVKGYYKQTADIDMTSSPSGFDWDWHFIGTYDGNNKNIKLRSDAAGNGLFGQLGINNSQATEPQAVVKNLSIKDVWFNCGGANGIIAKSMWNTTLENVDVTSTAAPSSSSKIENENGWLSFARARNCKFIDCSFVAKNYNIGSLLGGNGNYTDSITFTNCTLDVKSYRCIYHKGNASGEYALVTTCEGLTITGELAA